MIDGRHTGTGGGNHVVLGGADAGRQPVPAPARSAQELVALLAASSVALVPVFRPVHRPDQPGTAHRRSPARHALRTRNRLAQVPRPADGEHAALAGRSAVPQSARRRHRQHASHRILHRQVVFARQPDRPARSRRIPLVRNAAARAHEPGAAITAAGADRLVLAEPLDGALVRWGTTLHDRFMLPHFVWADFLDVLDDLKRRRLSVRSGLVRRAARNSAFPLTGPCSMAASSWKCAGALEPWHVLGEEGVAGGTVRYRRFIRRARAGQGPGLRRGAPCRHLQRPRAAADRHRPSRRVRRRRALQGLGSRRLACIRPSRRMRR